ncbi:MAG: HepT-like ribonuclease domain-containing protein [Patescibacteria group bacterium]|nr:HepT-like ribonuclease domain-containing protein [Patescibacteria group bacterium]
MPETYFFGEATKNLPKKFTDAHKKIDWKSIAGMRDRLIHHYFGVDYEIVWDVVKTEIPKLNRYIKTLLKI